MEGNAWHELLGCLYCLGGGGINQKFSILGTFDAKSVKVLLELISELLHGGHVGKKDWLNKSLLDELDLWSIELTAQEVIFHDVKEFNGLSRVEIFLHMLLSVHLANGRLGDDMVSVVEAVVLDIMAKGSDDERQIVEVIILGELHEILGPENHTDMLSDIWPM